MRMVRVAGSMDGRRACQGTDHRSPQGEGWGERRGTRGQRLSAGGETRGGARHVLPDLLQVGQRRSLLLHESAHAAQRCALQGLAPVQRIAVLEELHVICEGDAASVALGKRGGGVGPVAGQGINITNWQGRAARLAPLAILSIKLRAVFSWPSASLKWSLS